MWARWLEIPDTIIRETKCFLTQSVQRQQTYYATAEEKKRQLAKTMEMSRIGFIMLVCVVCVCVCVCLYACEDIYNTLSNRPEET